MDIQFKKTSMFNRGIFFNLLKDAYSFDIRNEEHCKSNWEETDKFFFDNLEIADKYAFVTTLKDEVIGFICWDPRNMPEYAEIGHNCIATKHKGKGYGKIQLQEAIKRITQNDVKKIIVTTNVSLVPAMGNYESVGFTIHQKRKGEDYFGECIDYVYYL